MNRDVVLVMIQDKKNKRIHDIDTRLVIGFVRQKGPFEACRMRKYRRLQCAPSSISYRSFILFGFSFLGDPSRPFVPPVCRVDEPLVKMGYGHARRWHRGACIIAAIQRGRDTYRSRLQLAVYA